VRVLGLDIGEKRTGVAVSDPGGSVATPLTVLDTPGLLGGSRELARIVEDYEVELAVVGLPFSLDGTEGRQAARVRDIAMRLAGSLPEQVIFVDERYTSAEASRRMREAGASERQQRGSVDMVAASVLLQGYLDGLGGRAERG
jgi:putative Holliday junction resolvase